jgi:aspartate racemase
MSEGPPATVDRKPIVGILGGMGPAATADFFTKLVAATPAEQDQEHIQVLIWSDPMVPDRTAALLNHGPDPTAWLIRGAELLVTGGADLIAVPCNTAHAFLEPVERQVGVEIVHMIDQVAHCVAALTPPVRRVGVLATAGTVHAGLYDRWLARHHIDVVVPATAEQQAVSDAIKAVKSGIRHPSVTEAIARAGESLVARGAQALIAGCTEIPLVFGTQDASVPVIDPTDVLADAVVAAVAGHQERSTRRHEG